MFDRFPPRYHSNRPDSSEDILENSSTRSFSVIDSLLKGSGMYIETQNITLVCSQYRSLREKKQFIKPDNFLNFLNYNSSLNNFVSKYLKGFAICINMTHTR